MKVTFITNYMTHHQLPFAMEMYKILGEDFCFIETNNMEAERKSMGWELDKDQYPFVHVFEDYVYDSLIEDVDVVILGGTHQVYLGKRFEKKKLTFRYFERLYKKGQMKAYIPSSYVKKVQEHTKRKNDPVYLLCAGAYVASDFSIFGAYPEKMFKWGYFPELEKLDIEDVIDNKKHNEILWTGRMIDWKQPLEVLKAAKILKESQKSFHITMIGDGDYRKKVMDYIVADKLDEYVTVLGFMEPVKVREYMKKASVYLMTSTMEEGWGAVVNEAMNSGCVVVGSYAAGSVPYLIKDGENGFIYNYKNVKELAGVIDRIISDNDMAKCMGKNAYHTILKEWNAEIAAKRFIELCNNLLQDRIIFEESGPLSKAYNVKPSKGYNLCKKKEFK